MKELTEREQVMITFAALQTLQGVKPNYQQLYILSRDKAVISTAPSVSGAERAQRWKNSARVVDFFRAESARLETWISEREAAAGREAILSLNGGAADNDIRRDFLPGGVAPKNGVSSGEIQNYAERGAMLQELNKLANTARDSREKLDALKIIADLQRFKDTATSEKPEIKRFYMPLRCQNCELYKRAKEKNIK